MGRASCGDIEIHYETLGQGEPVLLLAGLAGVGRSWGAQVDLFAERFSVILPDHRGTGRSTPTREGMTIAQHAEDMCALLDHLDIASAHVVGSSTGGAIAQEMAIRFSARVRSMILANSLAQSDAYYDRQFWLRRTLMAKAGNDAAIEANSLFLFSPEFTRKNPALVDAWIEAGRAAPFDPDIAEARIEMILRHDTAARLDMIRAPTLVIAGRHDACTPLHMARQLTDGIAGARLVELDTGHFGFIEVPELFFGVCADFISGGSDR